MKSFLWSSASIFLSLSCPSSIDLLSQADILFYVVGFLFPVPWLRYRFLYCSVFHLIKGALRLHLQFPRIDEHRRSLSIPRNHVNHGQPPDTWKPRGFREPAVRPEMNMCNWLRVHILFTLLQVGMSPWVFSSVSLYLYTLCKYNTILFLLYHSNYIYLCI